MSLRTKLLLAEMLTLAVEGKLLNPTIIGEPKSSPYNEKYDIAAREAAETKRQRKAKKKETR